MCDKDLCIEEQISRITDILRSIIDCDLEQTFRRIDESSDEVVKHRQLFVWSCSYRSSHLTHVPQGGIVVIFIVSICRILEQVRSVFYTILATFVNNQRPGKRGRPVSATNSAF